MVKRLQFGEQVIWYKAYTTHVYGRQAKLLLWNRLTRGLRVPVLRAPTCYAGERAKQLEQGRLDTLAKAGVWVPTVVGSCKDALLLSHMGKSVSHTMKRTNSLSDKGYLAQQVMQAIVDIHCRGHYLGQPVTRNIIWKENRVGFIDFEEDLLQIMPMHQAQARDWLLFIYTLIRHYRSRLTELENMVQASLSQLDAAVLEAVQYTTHRLRCVAPVCKPLGEKARDVSRTIELFNHMSKPA